MHTFNIYTYVYKRYIYVCVYILICMYKIQYFAYLKASYLSAFCPQVPGTKGTKSQVGAGGAPFLPACFWDALCHPVDLGQRLPTAQGKRPLGGGWAGGSSAGLPAPCCGRGRRCRARMSCCCRERRRGKGGSLRAGARAALLLGHLAAEPPAHAGSLLSCDCLCCFSLVVYPLQNV